MQVTDEQEEIVACNDDLIVVNAFAGSGKTTSLCKYSEYRPNKRFLYLAYNKAMQQEAQERFPSNVTASTTHSIAYRAIGFKYKDKLGDIRPLDIAERFNVDYRISRIALETLNLYFASSDNQLRDTHLPADVLSQRIAGDALDVAKKVWLAAVDKADSQIAMPHDGYLKLCAISKIDLASKFDTILFDEAQDANPVISQIVFAQKNTQKIIVGDRYQAIYGFRGAFNAMEALSEIEASHFHLTKCFRFGQDVADLASSLLIELREEERFLVGMRPGHTAPKVDVSQPYAHLHRTNAGLLKSAAWCAERNVPFALLGGVRSYAFDRIIDVHHLFEDRKTSIKDGFVKRFSSFGHLKDYADSVNDVPTLGIIKLIDEYRKDVPLMVSMVQRKNIDLTNVDADTYEVNGRGLVTMSTAHRVKGLGFDQVFLSDDFPSLFDEDTGSLKYPTSRQEEEEINLIYVAITRAKQALQLNEDIKKFQAHYLQRFAPKEKVKADRPAFSLQ